MALFRVHVDGEVRWARGPAEEGPATLLAERASLDELLAVEGGGLERLLSAVEERELPGEALLLPPIGTQDVWAAGVTYERSRAARTEESAEPDVYDRVYDAERPELFLKATGGRVRGPGDPIAIRADSGWNVPEPELGVLVDASGVVVAYLLGDDVSSRSIEGENPLYLPQAKVYDGSCALGPCLVPIPEAPSLDDLDLSLTIGRDAATLFKGQTSLAALRRRPSELVDWLFAASTFPTGVLLLTGTGIVPDADVSLQPGDVVHIHGTGLGELVNTVEATGRVPGATARGDRGSA